jgi:L-rhamnose mutarotase
MQRIGLLLNVRPEKLEEYRQLHKPIPADLAAELKAAGISNYSLWLRPDGVEFGYLECEDWEAACEYLKDAPAHVRWQEQMREYLLDESQGGQPVELLEMAFLLP